MEAIARAAVLLATTALGLSAGALLAEGAILVPFWRSCGGLFEDEVGPVGFEIPIDDRYCGQVERGMRAHQHPELAGDREDGAEHEPDDRGLFGAGESLDRVMGQSKQDGGEQHDESLGPRAGSEQLAETFEQVPAE